jgi:hypothetical protein
MDSNDAKLYFASIGLLFFEYAYTIAEALADLEAR